MIIDVGVTTTKALAIVHMIVIEAKRSAEAIMVDHKVWNTAAN
jgi:hypothetical protein